MSERRIFAMLFSHYRLTTSMHESSRYVVVTTSLLVGEATKPSDIENTLCITSEARRRDEKHIVANRLLAPSREGAPGCSVLCIRYWTDTIFAFSFPVPSLSVSSRSCFFSYLLSPFPISSLLSVRRRGGALKCRRPDTYSFDADGPSSSVQREQLFFIPLAISILRCHPIISIPSESDRVTRVGLLAIFSQIWMHNNVHTLFRCTNLFCFLLSLLFITVISYILIGQQYIKINFLVNTWVS